MAHKRKGRRVGSNEVEVDLTPMIDIIFLLIIFFILAGKITSEVRVNWVTVPPTKTAQKMEPPARWGRVVIAVSGSSQETAGSEPAYRMQVNKNEVWVGQGVNDFVPYQRLRELLDAVYINATKYDDPKGTGMKLPEVVVEIRADQDAEYRIVQEIMQVASDSVNPYPDAEGNAFKPKDHSKDMTGAKSFVNIIFTTFKPDDRG